MGSETVVIEEQRRLLSRVERLVRLIRRDMAYYGSKNTDDLGAAVHERLVRAPDLNAKFRREPSSLFGLLRTVVNHVLVDEIRYSAARRRKAPDLAVARLELQEQRGVQADTRTPALERDFCRSQEVAQVMRALDEFLEGRFAGRIRAARRQAMVQALRLSWEGHSHAEIASRLSIPKSTVGHHLDALSVLLARHIAKAGGDLDQGVQRAQDRGAERGRIAQAGLHVS